MGFDLGPKASGADYRLAAFDTIGSTSAEAMERAREGDPGRLWVVARMQTAGHGRRGRAWQTPGGNLAASLLAGGAVVSASAAQLGFVAGLALEGAIRACAFSSPGPGRQPRVQLKWPNDVLLDDAKVAGILLEAVTVSLTSTRVVIGVGVNVRHAPSDLPYPAASLAAHGLNVSAEELFAALSDAWVEQEERWDEGRGFPAIRRGWLERAAGLGTPLQVGTGDRVLQGVFDTIDEEGRLIIRARDGSLRSVTAGEVHFGAAATVGA